MNNFKKDLIKGHIDCLHDAQDILRDRIEETFEVKDE